jgi:ADP-ribose pyrophosphatase
MAASPQPEDTREIRVNSESVYDGRLLKVKSDTVRLANGRHTTREYIQHPGAAMILALPEDKIILIRQYRYPLDRHFIELPAGKIDPGEDPLQTAKREFIEECGYEAAEWRHLTTLHPCIGYSDERIELYHARELTDVGRKLDDGEYLDVMHVPLAEAFAWVREGRITEPKAVMGLLWAERIARGEW